MTLQQTFNELTGQNQTMVQDGEYTAETVNEPRERLTKDTKLKLSQIKREEVADKRYKPGEISEKTGLQKQPDGSWAEPKGNESARISKTKKDREKVAKQREGIAQTAVQKYKDLPGEQRKDALYAATHEGISVATTQNSMERGGWSLTKADNSVNVYEKPDGSKVTMKLEGNKVKSVDYQTPENKPAAKKPAASKKAENTAGNYEAILKKATPEQRKVIEAVEEDMQMVSEDDLDKSSYKKLNDAYGQFMETGDLGKLKEAATILQQASGRKYNTASLPSAAAKKTPAAKKTGADLSKVTHFDLDMARNAMNTTPAEDQQLDYFITEMHEDGTSLENIIKRQDGIYERSEGRYPKEEAVYKSLREKIMKHYGAR